MSPNAPSKRDILGTLFLSVLAGRRPFINGKFLVAFQPTQGFSGLILFSIKISGL